MLALKYRPARLSDFSGQPQVLLVIGELLRQHLAAPYDQIIPAGIILTGPRGAGKTSLARVIASALNCYVPATERQDGREPCGECVSCRAIYNQNSDSVLEIDGATSGGVDDIRQIKQLATLSHSGAYRVIIVDECHAMSAHAWSALLKQLEEPPEGVLYILVTTDYHLIPETIKSRCLVFRYLPIADSDIVSRLQYVCAQERLVYDAGALPAIARRAKGALRDALMMLEQLSIVGGITEARINLLWPDDLDVFAQQFMESVERGDVQRGMSLVYETFNQYRDAFEMANAIVRRVQIEILTIVEQNKSASDAKKLAAVMSMLWDVRVKLRTAVASDPTPLILLWYAARHQFAVPTQPIFTKQSRSVPAAPAAPPPVAALVDERSKRIVLETAGEDAPQPDPPTRNGLGALKNMME